MSGGQLYRTSVAHARPRLSPYRFRYRLFHLLLDVDQLSATARRLRLFSYNRTNVLSFHDRDFGPGDGTAPRAWLEPLLRRHGHHFDLARIEVLCMPRVLGRAFNPLTVWYCRDARDALRAVVCEVHNTFGERHSYVLGAADGALSERAVHRVSKRFFVSPFLPLAGAYEFRLRLPGERIGVQIDYQVAGMSLLHASLQGVAAPLDDWQLARALARMPLQTVRVLTGIHWQALKLWWRGAPIFDRLQTQEV